MKQTRKFRSVKEQWKSCGISDTVPRLLSLLHMSLWANCYYEPSTRPKELFPCSKITRALDFTYPTKSLWWWNMYTPSRPWIFPKYWQSLNSMIRLDQSLVIQVNYWWIVCISFSSNNQSRVLAINIVIGLFAVIFSNVFFNHITVWL